MQSHTSPYVRQAAASDRTEREARQERRYCQDCRFFQSTGSATTKQFGRCLNAAAPTSDIDRFIAPEFDKPPFASTMRSIESRCGADGKWFEAADDRIIPLTAGAGGIK